MNNLTASECSLKTGLQRSATRNEIGDYVSQIEDAVSDLRRSMNSSCQVADALVGAIPCDGASMACTPPRELTISGRLRDIHNDLRSITAGIDVHLERTGLLPG